MLKPEIIDMNQYDRCYITFKFPFCSFWAPLNIAIFNTLIILLTVSHLRAVTSDPGMVPLPTTRIDFSHLHAAKKKVRYLHNYENYEHYLVSQLLFIYNNAAIS